jgi:hypothetical protein
MTQSLLGSAEQEVLPRTTECSTLSGTFANSFEPVSVGSDFKLTNAQNELTFAEITF